MLEAVPLQTFKINNDDTPSSLLVLDEDISMFPKIDI